MSTKDLISTLSPLVQPNQFSLKYKRLFLPVALVALLANTSTRELAVASLSDSFWAVSAYVAATLVIYHLLANTLSKQNWLSQLYHHSRNHQVGFAALLGALPGCGGAIVVTTQFVRGQVGFGAVVAVLTSTMGDAAFLLLAAEPSTGFGVIAMGVVVGALSGRIVNAIHADDFLRPQAKKALDGKLPSSCCKADGELHDHGNQNFKEGAINLQGAFWKWILIPTTVVAVLGSFQVDVNELFHLPANFIEWTGAILAVVSMFLWSMTRELEDYQTTVSEDAKVVGSHPIQKAAQDTNFISAWVIIAFLAFELLTMGYGENMESQLAGYGAMMPFAGVLVGLLPGCGPQILVTSMYLSNVIPFSAQIANAISNDGDALFPAIAMAPRAALVATIYSAIPALLVGYGWYFLFE